MFRYFEIHVDCEYPYISKSNKVVEEENYEITYQFVKKSNGIAAEYGGTNTGSILDTEDAIIGPPNKYPNYGEFSSAFVMQTNGFDVSSTSSWQKKTHIASEPQNDCTMYCNYIDLEFEEAVYPLRISIYEVYNPGYVTEVWAQDFDGRWFQLWTAKPRRRQIVPSTSRIFSPPLQSFDFRTKIIRLKFMNSLWNYSTQLDAVQLIGTKEMIIPNNQQNLIDLLDNNCERSYHQDIMYNLTSDYKNISDKSKEQSYGNFDHLPDEILLKIFKNLDVTSLCRMGRVNKRFNDLTRDPALFKCLKLRNLRPIKSTRINTYNSIIPYFESRCHFLKQLDLTTSDISVETFVKFLDNCGSRLTHLRLSNCPFVDDSVLKKISEVCKKLKVLDLSDLVECDHLNEGFSHLENLDRLEDLNLEGTFIEVETLCKILHRNYGIRNLNLGGPMFLWSRPESLEAILMDLKYSCPEVEKLNLSRGHITPRGIDALTKLQNLRNLEIWWIIKGGRGGLVDKPTIFKLFSSCQRLEEINNKNRNQWEQI